MPTTVDVPHQNSLKMGLGGLSTGNQLTQGVRNLHTEAKQAREETLLEGEFPYFDPIIFIKIDDSSIATAAMRTRGAASPSGIDAEGWRRILISRNYGTTGKDLQSSIAKMTQILCTREIKQYKKQFKQTSKHT